MRDLLKILEQQREESDSSLFENRDQMRRNMEYYAALPFGDEQAGRSRYVSPDVHDAVESFKALFRETFLSSRDVVRFVSDGSTSGEEAIAKTKYVNRAFDAAGKAQMFSDLWHDAFVCKRGSILVERVPDPQDVEIPVDGAPYEMVQAQLAQMGNVVSVDESDVTAEVIQSIDPMTGQIAQNTVLRGTIRAVIDEEKWSFTVMEPERYLRDPQAATIEDSMWCIYMDFIPRGTLIRRGYDRDQIEGLSTETRYNTNEIDQSRKAFDHSDDRKQRQSRHDEQENVTVYKTWTWLNLSKIPDYDMAADEVRLYEVHWVKDEILKWADGNLAIREVDEVPIFEWSQLRIPHAESSMCVADLVAHNQRAKSQLQRAIINNQNIRNSTRFEAVPEQMYDPAQLIDNTLGGVVFTESIGSVAPLATPELSPLTFQALQMIDLDNERRSGMNSLAKGMNTDALRYQNAADMVDRLTNAAKTRPMGAARDFAETFLIPLCKYLVRKAMEVDFSQSTVESGGKQIVIAPQSWQSDASEMKVVAALTPQEAEDQAQKLLTMHQLISADPLLSQLYGIQQRHAVIDEVFEAMGISDTTKYLMRPDSPEFRQQQQIQEQMQQAQQMQAMQMAQMQAQMQQMMLELEYTKEANRQLDRMEDNTREDFKARLDERQGDRKLDIEEMKAN